MSDPLFPGSGEMVERCRAFDWASTPLGPAASWSQSLRTTAATVLNSRNPMLLWWGAELIQIYNDAYRPTLGQGDRHPAALGARAREFWADLWGVIGARVEPVMTHGESSFNEDQYLPSERDGEVTDVWWTYSYSPVWDDDGRIGGTLVVCLDTTQRVMAARERERLLAETARAERRATRVLERVADEHLTMDADFRILTMNAAAERALGPREQFIGRTHWEAFPASVGTPVEQQYRKVQSEGVEAHVAHHYVGEGFDRYLEIDAYPTEERGVALFWRDVSKRKHAEIALMASELRYRTLFESIDEGFCVIEVLFDDAGQAVDYCFVEANQAFETHTGLRNVAGRRITQLVPDQDAQWFELYGRIAMTGATQRFEAPAPALNRWYEGYAFRIGDAAERQVAVLFKDVTAQRLARDERERLIGQLEVERARLAYIFKQAPAFLAVLRGPDLVFELVNDAFYQLVGQRDILGKPLFEALPEFRGQGYEAILATVVRTGEPFVGREIPLMVTRQAGAPAEEHFLDLVYLPLVDADGTRDGIIAHGTDVTEQVLARREVERLFVLEQEARAVAETSYREAEAANQAKAEFLAVMSHELRTPLNAIGGYAELLDMGLRGAVSPAQRDDLRRIQNSQRHLLGLINEVLNYARLETGTVQYDTIDVPVLEALRAAESLVAPQARSREIALVIAECAPGLVVRADSEKLRQILVNLLSNAVKFTDAEGRIELSAVANGEQALIHVSDTGIGIPPEKHEAIFDPFVQVRSDLTRPHEGTGLGLAISRDLARGMGGDLVVESAVGAGSTFIIALPLAASP